MFVKTLLTTFILASSSFALASPQMHKRDIHNRHAHLVARSPIPVLRSTEATNPLGRRHTRTKRCTNRPKVPDTGAPIIKVEAVNSTPAQPQQQQPPKNDPPPQSNPPPAQPEPEQPSPPSAPSGGGTGQTMSGDGTYYDAGLGACGITNTNADFIVAVSYKLFDTYPGYAGGNPNNNPICNKVIIAHYNGNSVPVTITDRCAGCEQIGALDFTPTAFSKLADMSVGRIHGVTWEYPA